MRAPAGIRFPALADRSLVADGSSLDDVAGSLGVTRERARQIQGEALRNARALLADRLGLDDARALAQDQPGSTPVMHRSRPVRDR